jgi:hypothetical protein
MDPTPETYDSPAPAKTPITTNAQVMLFRHRQTSASRTMASDIQRFVRM